MSHEIIDSAPANHTYTGGCLGNLADPSCRRTPDYLCGEFTWDGGARFLNWYHWQDGGGWRRTRITDDTGIAVGMGIADLTGTGTGDIVATEWRLGQRGRDDETGHIYWFEQPADPYADEWPRHVLATGWEKTHDLLIGDLRGAGNADVLVRMKDGRMSWFEAPAGNPRQPWTETLVVDEQAGDGTALYDITGSGCIDIVTATGFYENTQGDGSTWVMRPFEPLVDLRVDVETRVAAGDLLGDGSVCVVIAESELLQHARLLVLHSDDRGVSWTVHTLIEAQRDLGALHTLQLINLDNPSGQLPDIFVAEMELYRSDVDFVRRPTWRLLRNLGELRFDERIVLDANLGAHMGAAGHISDPLHTDFVAKNWSANTDNDCDGLNHVVHVIPESTT